MKSRTIYYLLITAFTGTLVLILFSIHTINFFSIWAKHGIPSPQALVKLATIFSESLFCVAFSLIALMLISVIKNEIALDFRATLVAATVKFCFIGGSLIFNGDHWYSILDPQHAFFLPLFILILSFLQAIFFIFADFHFRKVPSESNI